MEHPTSTTAPFRVMIVDDHPLMRRGVRQLLELDSVFSVVAEASNGSEAIALAGRSQPDLILLDLNMKGLSGLDTLKALRSEGIDARIIILTVSDARSDVYALVDAGADSYLLKDSEPEALLAQIRQAAEGRSVFSESVSAYLSTRSEIADPLADLTERELDVLQEVVQACPTNRSPHSCIFRRRPSRCTSATCCASSTSVPAWPPRCCTWNTKTADTGDRTREIPATACVTETPVWYAIAPLKGAQTRHAPADPGMPTARRHAVLSIRHPVVPSLSTCNNRHYGALPVQRNTG